jgi:hypothetical protein
LGPEYLGYSYSRRKIDDVNNVLGELAESINELVKTLLRLAPPNEVSQWRGGNFDRSKSSIRLGPDRQLKFSPRPKFGGTRRSHFAWSPLEKDAIKPSRRGKWNESQNLQYFA